MTERKAPKNALQLFIADWLSENPDETYSSIGKRGAIGRSSVWHLAHREMRQTPQPDTIRRLADGMKVDPALLWRVVGEAIMGVGNKRRTTPRTAVILHAIDHLNDERLELLARRARLLLAEQSEEEIESQARAKATGTA